MMHSAPISQTILLVVVLIAVLCFLGYSLVMAVRGEAKTQTEIQNRKYRELARRESAARAAKFPQELTAQSRGNRP